MGEDKRAEVVRFLAQFKKVAAVGHIQFVERLENNETVRDLGYNQRVCEDLILGLTTDEYSRGPDEDRGRPGQLWVFGKRIGREIYIKLKVYRYGGRDYAKCISFHYSEAPLNYPLRKQGELD